MAVHVRLERRHRIDLDDRDAAAGPAGGAREPLADPAVADDAELPPGKAEVRQPVDRRERRLPGAVAVVEEVLAASRRSRRSPETSGVRRPPSRAGARRPWSSPPSRRRARRPPRADARRSGRSARSRRRRRSRARCPPRPAGRRGTPPRSRRAGRAPRSRARRARRRPRPASSRDSSPTRRPRLRPRRGSSRGRRSSPRGGRRPRRAFRAAPRRRAAPREAVEDGRVARDPADPLLALRGERGVGDARAGGGVHRGESIRASRVPPRAPDASRGGEAQEDWPS